MPHTKSLYSVHPGVLSTHAWLATLKEKSGRSLEEWLALVKESGPAGEKERGDWLEQTYGLGTNAAWWIAERAEGKGTESDDPAAYLRLAEEYVEEMFSGPKQALKPVYDELLHLCLSLGTDVKACPCQTMVPLYRNHVFAQIKPVTRTRIDVGFALGLRQAQGRLLDTGGFAKKDRITHRIAIASIAGIDSEVKRWLQAAYDEDV